MNPYFGIIEHHYEPPTKEGHTLGPEEIPLEDGEPTLRTDRWSRFTENFAGNGAVASSMGFGNSSSLAGRSTTIRITITVKTIG